MPSRIIYRILRIVAFLVLAGICFSYLSRLFHYKCRYEKVIRTFLSEPRDSYDVIALGSSHMYCTLNPVELFRNFGVRSYVLATRRQPLAVSYNYLKMALERQHPKVVILETFMLVNNENYFRIEEGVVHDSLDPMPLSLQKLETLNAFDHEGAPEDYLVPFIKYHSRWKELERQDFLFDSWMERDFCKGFKLFCRAKQVNAKPVDYRTVAFCPVREEYFTWVDKMNALATSHGAKLLLLTAPYDVSGFKDALPQLKMAKSLHAYAQSKGILFLDMNQGYVSLGLDNQKDFFDFGHLNVYGAGKATQCIGRFLMGRCSLARATISESEKKLWASDAVQYDKQLRYLAKEKK